ncbi:segregation/condensation protein A [Alteribacillus bidgolensis]|uniref:Segregation and condensation protein A n=1 Tax=Alteribacillus bidgolensis TaxID=930129 RepID=A0A1G8BYE5_9BACI|nr:segregation/condensation protein A [Alteribacillus bidgolensis]SDH38089.1 condensin subunit ScpA [Alteribacillus bidgolensis]
MKRYNVKIDSFEGPLDLLLHLIHQAEVDIYNIPAAVITEQYCQYVQTMQELELDVASEYLVMAATLLEIKSKMLLPQDTEYKEEDLVDIEEDPREELLSRLVKYKKYKEAAHHLKEKEKTASSYYAKAPTVHHQENDDSSESESTLPEDLTLFDMLKAYQKLKKRIRVSSSQMTTVKAEEISIEEKMDDIVHILEKKQGEIKFYDLFLTREKPHIVVTFLAVLELMKHKKVTCIQAANFEDIKVEYIEEAAY